MKHRLTIYLTISASGLLFLCIANPQSEQSGSFIYTHLGLLAVFGPWLWLFMKRVMIPLVGLTLMLLYAFVDPEDSHMPDWIERPLLFGTEPSREPAVPHRPAPRPSTTTRKPIPDDVKLYVWRRDGGRCVGCGSNVNLEFDHIIPVSMGGSNTARNVQLLCEECNRAKGAKLA